jgi:hypothetical protein
MPTVGEDSIHEITRSCMKGTSYFFSTELKRTMTDEQTNRADTMPPEADLDQAELAHSIIESLLEHTRVVSDLIAVMAQALDQDTTKALTLTAQWQAYLESRRRMEQTHKDVEKFVAIVKKSAGD